VKGFAVIVNRDTYIRLGEKCEGALKRLANAAQISFYRTALLCYGRKLFLPK